MPPGPDGRRRPSPACRPRGGALLPGPGSARALVLLALLGGAAAQEPAGEGVMDFRTPDGSRFVLLRTGGPPLLHWALASPCGPEVDPPDAPGLAAACARASLRGTWPTGSRDQAAERAAIAALDLAEAELARTAEGPAPAGLEERVRERRAAAAALADPQAFRRALLAAPSQQPEIAVTGSSAVLTLGTAPFALREVARLLLERREQQSLRGWRGEFEAALAAAARAWDEDPMAPLRAEAVALAFAGSRLARAADRPAARDVTRALAERTWAQTQHPSRTVHVLLGDFDLAAARAVLTEVFARTALPHVEPLTPARVRPSAAERRAVVTGTGRPRALLAWPLLPDEDPFAARCLSRWFAEGADSWLGRELHRAGHGGLQVRGRAPWPAQAATGLFVVEVVDPAAAAPAGPAEAVLALAAAAEPKEPRPGELEAAHGSALAAWHRAAAGPGERARWFAARLVAQPDAPVPPVPAQELDYGALPAMLQRILDRKPIVVAWRNP